ncbi:unnamed protein product [Rhizophagus irregularis]|nr:unnamed protein product [Rhizophagus irregularis]
MDLGNDLSFFTKVKRQGVYPFLKYKKSNQVKENDVNLQKNQTCVASIRSNVLRDATNNLGINNNSMQDDEEIKNGELIFAELETYLDNAKKIVIEQHQVKNYRWANSVIKNFSGMKKVVDDIKSYSRRTTFPRTWKDHNENTMFLE